MSHELFFLPSMADFIIWRDLLKRTKMYLWVKIQRHLGHQFAIDQRKDDSVAAYMELLGVLTKSFCAPCICDRGSALLNKVVVSFNLLVVKVVYGTWWLCASIAKAHYVWLACFRLPDHADRISHRLSCAARRLPWWTAGPFNGYVIWQLNFASDAIRPQKSYHLAEFVDLSLHVIDAIIFRKRLFLHKNEIVRKPQDFLVELFN